MSPEYHRINDVPNNFRIQLKDDLDGKYNSAVQNCFILFKVTDGNVFRLQVFKKGEEEEYASLISAARKENCCWHLIHPLSGSSSQQDGLNLKLDGKVARGYTKKKYPGNHRSNTRGKGYIAFERYSSKSRGRR